MESKTAFPPLKIEEQDIRKPDRHFTKIVITNLTEETTFKKESDVLSKIEESYCLLIAPAKPILPPLWKSDKKRVSSKEESDHGIADFRPFVIKYDHTHYYSITSDGMTAR